MFQCCAQKFPLSLYSFGRCTRSGDAYGHLLVSNLNFFSVVSLRLFSLMVWLERKRLPFEFVHPDLNQHGNKPLVEEKKGP